MNLTATETMLGKRRINISSSSDGKRVKSVMLSHEEIEFETDALPIKQNGSAKDLLGKSGFTRLHVNHIQASASHKDDPAGPLKDNSSLVPVTGHENSAVGQPTEPAQYLITFNSSDNSNSKLEEDPKGRKLLAKEIRLLSGLSHAHIAKIHHVASSPECEPYIVTDKLSCTLADKLSHWRRTHDHDLRMGLRVVHSLAGVLDYLHNKKIIFRGLEPSAVGIDTAGNIKLFSFSLAKELPSEEDGPYSFTAMTGPRNYMAPENYQGKKYGLPADVYSFCILAWEVLSLKTPFSEVTDEKVYVESVVKGHHRPEVPKSWPLMVRNILRFGWATSPTMRPTIHVIYAALGSYLFGNPVSAAASGYISCMLMSNGTFTNI